MNRLDKLFSTKKSNILSVYATAGFPTLTSTERILVLLEKSGADMVEIGIPFSDPLADGVVIQQSSQTALENGMNLKTLFEQLKNVRQKVSIPLIMMGYLNPVLQFGVENFCKRCAEIGIDGVIIPDLPVDEFEEFYKAIFSQNNLHFHFLVTPQTSEERIKKIDNCSTSFIYLVSSASTTGAKTGIADEQIAYFQKMKSLNLKHPLMTGFGISNRETFETVCKYSQGAIIGSAFIKAIADAVDLEKSIATFITSIK